MQKVIDYTYLFFVINVTGSDILSLVEVRRRQLETLN